MDKLIEILQNYVELDSITKEMEFKADLGLSSFDTMCICDEIEDQMQKKVSPKDFSRLKTVGALAEFLAL